MKSDKSDWVFGIHVLRHFLQTKPEAVLEIFLSENREDKRIQEIVLLAQQFKIALQRVDKKQLDHQLPDVNHQGVAARIRPAPPLTERDLPDLFEQFQSNPSKKYSHPLFLVLDNVQDPHNLGACLRTADTSGVTAVIIPKDKTASLSPVVRKVASGGAETVPIVQVTNLSRTLEQLKALGLWIMGTSGEANQSLYQVDLKGPIAIVLGAEGTGLRRLTEEQCDILMHIPMLGAVESLNVSVAAGICLYEALRQRCF